MSLQISNLTVMYGDDAALTDINLSIGDGERFAVMGPSGAGKSTLLRVIAGLEAPRSGTVVVNGEDITTAPAHKRPVGLMFQDNALFPHMNVLGNVAYGLRMHGMPKRQRKDRARELLDLVSLDGFDERHPASLSGGEQQRVALARTLAPRPSLVLFDEPLGAIDQTLKDDLMLELISIVKAVGTTSVYVTHDRMEAEAFAEHMAILRGGRVVRSGSPLSIWQDPRTAFVAGFIGHRNVVNGEPLGLHNGDVVIPPDAIHPDTNGRTARIVARTFRDGAFEVTLDVDGQTIVMADLNGTDEGSTIAVDIDDAKVLRLSLDEV